jgi:PEP-CTERM motif
MQMRSLGLRAVVAAGGLCSALAAHSAVTFNVSFDDLSNSYAAYYTDITRHVQAAGADWMSRFDITVNTTLDVRIGFANIATANGASVTSSPVSSSGGINVFEQGAAAKIKTGVDANGAAPDIQFNFGINGYLQNELWFDPDPVAQTALVPINKTDARSVVLHEFGHALGFNGWRDGTTGALPSNFQSTFDQWLQLGSSANGDPTLFFTGAHAVAAYGGAVPVTFGNIFHVGNDAPRDGDDLLPDLMNGVVFYRGTRYQISALDLAIMQDAGLPFAVAAVPEPGSAFLLLGGGLLLAQAVRRQRRAEHQG